MMADAELHPDDAEGFFELSHCTLREVGIGEPFWTWCEQFTCHEWPDMHGLRERPLGWIWATGVYSSDGECSPIPWDGNNEPRGSAVAECTVCARSSRHGLVLERDGEVLQFCSDRHYVQWWRSVHDDDSSGAGNDASPEEALDER